MEDYKKQLIEVYNSSAEAMAEKFRAIGSRTDDIDRAIILVGKKQPFVVEVGCGDGRGAKEILLRTPNYIGVDISSGLLELARNLCPDGDFIEADISDYVIPTDTDIVFCFASLLHLPYEDVSAFLNRSHKHLNSRGVVYISLKHRKHYEKEIQTDEFGKRMFFYYNLSDIKDMSKNRFKLLYENIHEHGKTEWLTVALGKK